MRMHMYVSTYVHTCVHTYVLWNDPRGPTALTHGIEQPTRPDPRDPRLDPTHGHLW